MSATVMYFYEWHVHEKTPVYIIYLQFYIQEPFSLPW